MGGGTVVLVTWAVVLVDVINVVDVVDVVDGTGSHMASTQYECPD